MLLRDIQISRNIRDCFFAGRAIATIFSWYRDCIAAENEDFIGDVKCNFYISPGSGSPRKQNFRERERE